MSNDERVGARLIQVSRLGKRTSRLSLTEVKLVFRVRRVRRVTMGRGRRTRINWRGSDIMMINY